MASVPRNFKLLEELEDVEKGKAGGADISLGLENEDDTFMSDWNASIVQAPGGRGEQRIYFLHVHAGANYPKEPPAITFRSRIEMRGVDARGRVDPRAFSYLGGWSSDKTIYGCLKEIKAAIATERSPQPDDGLVY